MNTSIGKTVAGFFGVMAILLVAGCDGPVDVNGTARIDTTIEGGSESTGGSPSSAPSPEPATSPSTSPSSTATGWVDLRARVLVQAANGDWREVTRGFVDQRVRIDGSDGLKLLSQSHVEVGEYVRIRVEFEEVKADVTGGLTIGLGSLVGTVGVSAGADGRIVVEREVQFAAEARSNVRIAIGLNAREWLAKANSSTRVVSEADFRSAVMVAAR